MAVRQLNVPSSAVGLQRRLLDALVTRLQMILRTEYELPFLVARKFAGVLPSKFDVLHFFALYFTLLCAHVTSIRKELLLVSYRESTVKK